MKNEQNLMIDMGSFAYMMSAAIAFVLVVYFRWNFFIAAFLSALVGELFIRKALTGKTSDNENVPTLVAIFHRGWWFPVGLSIATVLFVVMRTHSTSDDYFWGMVIIVITLAKAGWIDWNHDRRSRAVIIFLSCISWALLPITLMGESTATATLLRVSLGFTTIAFLWSLADSIPENKIRGGTNWFFWIAGFSLANTIFYYLFGSRLAYAIGLAVTNAVDYYISDLAPYFGQSGIIVFLIGMVIDLFIAGIFVLFGILGKKRMRWFIILGMILYAVDGIIALFFTSTLGAAFHVWGLSGIWGDLKSIEEVDRLDEAENIVGSQ